jgi:hypothetical protein
LYPDYLPIKDVTEFKIHTLSEIVVKDYDDDFKTINYKEGIFDIRVYNDSLVESQADLLFNSRNRTFEDEELGNNDNEILYQGFIKKLPENMRNLLINFTDETDFTRLIKSLMSLRVKYPKNSYLNQYYKFIMNSGIGSMARGLSQKRIYNPSTNQTEILPTGKLTNPLYCSWVTSFIRCTLTELMIIFKNKGGEIVSCTTDGFLGSSNVEIKLEEYSTFSLIYLQALKQLNIN